MANERALAVLAERAEYTGEPSPRLKAVAALINGGMAVEKAMAEVKPPYGAKFIEGHAKTFGGVLVEMGLLTEAKAKKVTPPPSAAPAVVTTTERERI